MFGGQGMVLRGDTIGKQNWPYHDAAVLLTWQEPQTKTATKPRVISATVAHRMWPRASVARVGEAWLIAVVVAVTAAGVGAPTTIELIVVGGQRGMPILKLNQMHPHEIPQC